MERTLAIIKPDAVAARQVGAILRRIELAGFTLRGIRLVKLSRHDAEGFYAVHRTKPFFDSLVTFMSSGPAVVLVLESADAIRKWWALMGATDPAIAEAGSIRRDFGSSIEHNATHGSDAVDAAAFEVDYFFSDLEYSNSAEG